MWQKNVIVQEYNKFWILEIFVHFASLLAFLSFILFFYSLYYVLTLALTYSSRNKLNIWLSVKPEDR